MIWRIHRLNFSSKKRKREQDLDHSHQSMKKERGFEVPVGPERRILNKNLLQAMKNERMTDKTGCFIRNCFHGEQLCNFLLTMGVF